MGMSWLKNRFHGKPDSTEGNQVKTLFGCIGKLVVAYLIVGLCVALFFSLPYEHDYNWWRGFVGYLIGWPILVVMLVIVILAALANGWGI